VSRRAKCVALAHTSPNRLVRRVPGPAERKWNLPSRAPRLNGTCQGCEGVGKKNATAPELRVA
jgi:hypothetical protein